MIDPSKVNAGDEVTLRCEVLRVDASGRLDIRMPWSDGQRFDDVWVGWFAEHIPAPRKIEVGSRVQTHLHDRTLQGVVRAIVDDRAVVLWEQDSTYGGLALPSIAMLEVVD